MKVSANKLNKLICVLVMVAILLIAVNYIFAFYNVNDAFAFNSSNINDSVDIGNLLLDNYSDRKDGKVFNSESMTKLYEKLCGKENATIDDVAKLGVLDAGQIRKKNGNKDIILTIDNKQWTVTYLGVTNETQPQLYITLWLAQAPKDNDGNIATHKWNLWYENNTTSSYKFTSNMYSSSYIRAHALNSGNGYVATNGASSLRSISEDVKIAHEYANLTMSNDKVKDSLISYIIQPSKVGYQSSENHYVDCIGGIGSTLPNDAYGTPHGEVNWYKNSSGTVDMSVLSSKTGYGDWKNDYIWLPSLTETGYSDDLPGIWNLSSTQRSANSETESWLRSGDNGSAQYAFSLNSQGDSFNYPTVT
ncbi:MAG: hypothetical protein K2I79_01305, partial [Clostridia bacterium]|nr:hypothetical protein [Clostridia bacterium]